MPNSRHSPAILSPSSSRAMNFSRSSMRLHSFQGTFALPQKTQLCNPCARNELSPLSQEGQHGPEKACPALVAGWPPVFRQGHAQGSAPIAQLAERTAYTRRELRTGARLEVRALLGVPAFARPLARLRASSTRHGGGLRLASQPR